ncbi:MAG: DUF3244 domain-containing protein [Runella sp.]
MKTIITSLVCALAFSTATLANPTTEEKKATRFESSAFVTNDASVRVAVKKNAPERVYVTLKNNRGEVLFTETISKKSMSYAAKINVQNLTDGVYQLEIVSGSDRVVKTLNLTSKTVEVERKVVLN